MFVFFLSFIETLFEVFSIIVAAQALVTIPLNQFRATRRDIRKQLLLLLHRLESAAKPFILVNAAVTVVVSLLINAPRLYRTRFVTLLVDSHGSQILVVPGVIVIGLLAFWAKRNYLLQYGLAEIVFAAMSAYNVSEKLAVREAMLSKWTALGGAVYVVSRGMGNVMEARRILPKQSSPLDVGMVKPSGAVLRQ